MTGDEEKILEDIIKRAREKYGEWSFPSTPLGENRFYNLRKEGIQGDVLRKALEDKISGMFTEDEGER